MHRELKFARVHAARSHQNHRVTSCIYSLASLCSWAAEGWMYYTIYSTLRLAEYGCMHEVFVKAWRVRAESLRLPGQCGRQPRFQPLLPGLMQIRKPSRYAIHDYGKSCKRTRENKMKRNAPLRPELHGDVKSVYRKAQLSESYALEILTLLIWLCLIYRCCANYYFLHSTATTHIL